MGWRRPVAGLLAGGAGALVLLALLEGLLALAGLPAPGLYTGDPAQVWWLRPHLDQEVPGPGGPFRVRTNALGLRGDPPPAEGPWTLALGCSTTFGWGVAVEEAWPARLAALLGEPVVNGGVPGWSTAQAVRGAPRYLALGPSRVILAYLVRDAWPAPRPDHAVPPTPWPQRTHLFRLLRRSGDPGGDGGAATVAAGATWRVPPDRYAVNLRRLVAAAGSAEVILLAFPQQSPATPWVEAAAAVGPVLAPELPVEAYFAQDPIHLTPDGHRRLAAAVASAL